MVVYIKINQVKELTKTYVNILMSKSCHTAISFALN
jgi:hypothetical protein